MSEERLENYGIGVGDIVEQDPLGSGKPRRGEVIHVYITDRNRVRVRLEDGKETNFVAEWCTKVNA